ncbi:T-complex protein 1 subunit gamma-like [Zophobas morio]|uniref:T-complex protein 1 subunit gamma-like n=1 Tax=Zophobas morio TaxID=2755281 RepID=UPI0030835898
MLRAQRPVMVISQNVKREEGSCIQIQNINAAKAVCEVIRTCLGPKAMLKMLLDPMGGIVLTNDGNAILREIDVSHPAAKSMVEISRTQDEEVGDGTTSVIVLAGEVLSVSEPFLEQKIHPTVICRAYSKALDDILEIVDSIAVPINVSDKKFMKAIVKSCIGTKLAKGWDDMICDIALKTVDMIHVDAHGRHEIDLKRYAKIEKIPGGTVEECSVLDGIMLNKDITHPKMRRRIENPRIVLLDCPLEYKKGESQTNIELMKGSDWATILAQEEELVKKMCDDIIAVKPDLVFTEKGVSDLAQHYFVQAGITAIRRLRKSDNNRLARACGARIVSRPEELSDSDVGTAAGLFEVKKIGDDYFSFVTGCQEAKACTILLRGPSKDLLMELERNLQDALHVSKNIVLDPRLLPGGGATEMELASRLQAKANQIEGIEQWPYRAIAQSLEVIPRTLAQNCGSYVVRTITELSAKHSEEGHVFVGIDGESGQLADMRSLGVWEPVAVKNSIYKTAIESAKMLLRIDVIVSGMKAKKKD